MSIDTYAIEIAGMTKSYADNDVLCGIDLNVPSGTVYALLGPNGAGKTTMVRILSTLISADAGQARVAGFDVDQEPDEVRRSIGVTGQFSAVDDLLTARENLQLMADLNHLPRTQGRARAQELLVRFDLVDAADRGAATYSGGMKRRLDLAMTLVGSPRLIFLDEPSAGLDPRSRRELWQIVRELVNDGVTIFLTTQYLEEADELAHKVGVLDGGRLVAEGTPAELKRQVPGGRVEVTYSDPAALVTAASIVDGATADEGSLTLSVAHDGSLDALRRLLGRLDNEAVSGLEVRSPDLDDVFLALTGHRALSAEDLPDPLGPPLTRRSPRRCPMSATRLPHLDQLNAGPDVWRDSWTMLRRNLVQMVRYRSLTLMLIGQPLSSCCCSSTSSGERWEPACPGGDDRADYLVFIMPAIVVITVASVSLSTGLHDRARHGEGHRRPVPRDGDRQVGGPDGRVLGSDGPDSRRVRRGDGGGVPARLPQRRDASQLARCGRPRSPDDVRADLVDRRPGPVGAQRRDGEQHPDAADVPAVPLQRLRARLTRCRRRSVGSPSTSRSRR